MESRREPQTFNSDYGINTPICEEDLDDEEQLPYHKFSQEKHQVPMFSMNFGGHGRLAAVLLGLLAVVLLMVNIGLGVHYNALSDTHLTLDDTKLIGTEITELKETYTTALEAMYQAKKKKEAEMNSQKETQWEFEHQSQREKNYQKQVDEMTKEVAKLRPHLPLMRDGCKYCQAGWILMNSVCLYIPLSGPGLKTWQQSRDYCKQQGGDLAIIDSKDKQNATVSYLLSRKPSFDYWLGLKHSEKDKTWKWLDETVLVEGYWDRGEPDNEFNEDCAAVQAKENFFTAWRDTDCRSSLKWICEKTPATIL
ncbi:unnamed protein product [Ophioblennius macclurei]